MSGFNHSTIGNTEVFNSSWTNVITTFHHRHESSLHSISYPIYLSWKERLKGKSSYNDKVNEIVLIKANEYLYEIYEYLRLEQGLWLIKFTMQLYKLIVNSR